LESGETDLDKALELFVLIGEDIHRSEEIIPMLSELCGETSAEVTVANKLYELSQATIRLQSTLIDLMTDDKSDELAAVEWLGDEVFNLLTKQREETMPLPLAKWRQLGRILVDDSQLHSIMTEGALSNEFRELLTSFDDEDNTLLAGLSNVGIQHLKVRHHLIPDPFNAYLPYWFVVSS